MGKNPAFQFYPADWSRDLEEHPLEIEGAWIRICCKLWWSETRGQLTRAPEQWAKILRVDAADINRIILYIDSWKIGSVSIDPNGNITLISRRMLRDEKDRQNNCLRQKRHYKKTKPNAPITDTSQISSSSSSSSSLDIALKATPEPFRLPSKEEIENSSKPLILENIDKAADELYEKKVWSKVHSYKNAMLKRGCNERAILKSLMQCLIKKPENPWAYCAAIMKKEDGNFNARDYEKNHG